jgi:hypothetical protein
MNPAINFQKFNRTERKEHREKLWEHPTSNIQHPTPNPESFRGSMLGVGCFELEKRNGRPLLVAREFQI